MKTRIAYTAPTGEIYTAIIELPEAIKPLAGFTQVPKEVYPEEGGSITIMEVYNE